MSRRYDPDATPLTHDQIVAAFRQVLGCEPRQVDILVISQLGNSLEQLADYIWDHCMGEPEQPSYQQVEQQVREAIQP